MNDKERLNEIKRLAAERDKQVNEDGEIDYHNYDQYLYELNDRGHIDWLIDQAERVHELEKRNNELVQVLNEIRDFSYSTTVVEELIDHALGWKE